MLQDKVFQVSIVIVCALVIWSLINPVDNTVPATVGNVAAFLIFGFLASTFISAIYRVVKGTWPKWQVWISVPFIGIFMYLAYVGMQFDPQEFRLEAASSKSSNNDVHSEEIQEGDIDSLLEAVQKDPEDAWAWNNLGIAYGELNRNNDAIDAFRQAILIDPEYATAWYNLGYQYNELNLYDDAINAFRQAIRIDPDNAWAWTGLGITYGHLNRYDDAIDAFRQAIRIDPEYTPAWFGIGGAYHFSGNRDAALDALKELRRLDPVMANELFDYLVPR